MSSLLIAVGVIALIAFILVQVYNKFVKNRNVVKDAWSNIDVALKRRHDLIPNLVETVKGYATHEKETFENVVKARNAAMSASGDRKSTRLNSSHVRTSYAVFCLKKKRTKPP